MPDDIPFGELTTTNPAPERPHRRPKFKVADVAAALQKSAGVLAGAAQILAQAYGSCDRETVRIYLKRYPRLRQIADETVERTLDLAEHKLIAAIDNDHDWAIRFYLETKGKHRGYTKRWEHTGAEGHAIEVTSNVRVQFIAGLAEMAARLGPVTAGAPGPAVGGKPNGSHPPAEEAE